MNIHLPAILMFTRGTRFWHTAIYIYMVTWIPSIYPKWCEHIYIPAPWIRHGIDLPTLKNIVFFMVTTLKKWMNGMDLPHWSPSGKPHWNLDVKNGDWGMVQMALFYPHLKKMIIKSWRKILKLRDVKWKVVKFFQPGILMVLMWVAHAACPRAGCRMPPHFFDAKNRPVFACGWVHRGDTTSSRPWQIIKNGEHSWEHQQYPLVMTNSWPWKIDDP